ncbi:Metabotropic glutamate receptor 8 [Geodia barretti]|uniref:Metabotropic glutamate receptor 8 n=1 Tax=Geodia barretti TaxID=519541 RepID=A0AA35U1B2_GEOBA|nr:Metabotropic glutamate receptor 8 [Geodia barretti]
MHAKPSPNESGPGVYPVPTSGIVGAAGSRVSVPVASLGRLFNMPQVSYASTSPLLSDQTRYSYFRRTIPADDLQVQAMMDILQRFGWNYVSVLHSEDTYGSAGVNEFVRVSAINGICIDLRRGIQPSLSDSEYNTIVEDLGNSRAKVVVFFAIQDAVREVLTRIHRTRL